MPVPLIVNIRISRLYSVFAIASLLTVPPDNKPDSTRAVTVNLIKVFPWKIISSPRAPGNIEPRSGLVTVSTFLWKISAWLILSEYQSGTQNDETQDDRRYNGPLTEEQEAYFMELGWHSRALFAAALVAFTRNDEPEGRRLSQEDQRLKREAVDDRSTSQGEE